LVHQLEGLVRWQRPQHDEVEILLVEDDKMAAELLAEQIDDIVSEGYALYQEPTLEEAKEHVSTGLDYALLDRRLPGGKQGDELVRFIRSECPSCFILIVSGVAPDRKLLMLDIDDYVIKPVDRNKLAAHIESIEARRGLTDVKREYLAARSKQAALLAAYGRAAEARPEYRLLTEIIERLPLDEATQTALESKVPPVME
jgi:DNA-binding response OmpR family regulator